MSKFVKYLTRLGWNCVVFTSTTGPLREVFYDEQLIKEIPSSVKVVKVRSFIPKRNYSVDKKSDSTFSNINNFLIKILDNFIFPDPYVLWSLSAFIAARKLVRKDDIIITTLSAYSTALIGLFLKLSCNVKWVMDYRDGWTTDPFYRYVKIRRIFESSLELCCLRLANLVICVSEGLKSDIESAFSLSKKIYVIENGLDPEDYNYESVDNFFDKNLFNLVYTGVISERTMDISQLIYALDIVINKNNLKRIKVFFIGPEDNIDKSKTSKYKELISKLSLSENVFFIPPVSRQQSLMYQQQSSCLLLIYTSSNDLKSVMTSKIFDYIYAKKPILGLVNKSAVRDLIETNKLGICADPLNKKEIADSILNVYHNELNYPDESNFNNLIERYSRKNLTLKLSKLLMNI